ncbi:GNAT family N-acetyltransferase [Dysgonomonas capnocytophagoides]|uniref:GNAT family N-acetyltransferase n=1 Tax=Dysgonomonas capnocytophagoides TaxID=45254 RepID=UPI000415671F|nr:GNAT family N-acetyltransferase [Dysgonomonas capnocytophagoides]
MEMITIERTNSDNKDFRWLVQKLDSDLDERDKNAHSICAQFNNIETIKYAVIAYNENNAVGCGAIREYSQDTMEIKRMFVLENNRGNGIASIILDELESWAKDLGYKKCILETGEMLPEAVKLYEKNNYSRIPNYGQYECLGSSICFAKELST